MKMAKRARFTAEQQQMERRFNEGRHLFDIHPLISARVTRQMIRKHQNKKVVCVVFIRAQQTKLKRRSPSVREKLKTGCMF